jgi:hypothetical protein
MDDSFEKSDCLMENKLRNSCCIGLLKNAPVRPQNGSVESNKIYDAIIGG